MITDMHAHMPVTPGLGGERDLLAAAGRSGVGRLIVSDLADWSAFPDSAAVRAGNLRAARFAAAHPKEVWFLAYLNPQLSDAAAELRRCREEGAVGVKLWISLRGEPDGWNRTLAAVKLAAELALPVLVHTFSRTDALQPGEFDAAMLFELALAAPEATIIGAHAGGNVEASLEIIGASPDNLYWDLSGGFPRAGMLEQLLRHTRPEKLLWGSDAPGRSFDSQLAKVRDADVPDAARQLILNGNAERIFRLPNATLPAAFPAFEPAAALAGVMAADHFAGCGKFPPDGTPGATPEALNAALAAAGVGEGFAVNLNDLWRFDLAAANAAWLAAAGSCDRIVPLAMINVRQMDALFQLRAAARAGFAGVWVSPYCHNWRLDDDAFAGFWQAAAAAGLPVWINAALGDYRFRPSGLALRQVAAAELSAFRRLAPENRYTVQGMDGLAGFFAEFAGDGRFVFDGGKLSDHEGALAGFIGRYGVGQLRFGSEFPLRRIDQIRKSVNCQLSNG
jgi:hypothetical protein